MPVAAIPAAHRAKPGSRASAHPAYWTAVGLIAAGTLAIVPLYLQNCTLSARLDAAERFAEGVNKRVTLIGSRVQVMQAERAVRTDAPKAVRQDSSDPPPAEVVGCTISEASLGVLVTPRTCEGQ